MSGFIRLWPLVSVGLVGDQQQVLIGRLPASITPLLASPPSHFTTWGGLILLSGAKWERGAAQFCALQRVKIHFWIMTVQF